MPRDDVRKGKRGHDDLGLCLSHSPTHVARVDRASYPEWPMLVRSPEPQAYSYEEAYRVDFGPSHVLLSKLVTQMLCQQFTRFR